VLKKVGPIFSPSVTRKVSNTSPRLKAESELGEAAKREDLDAAINEARSTLLKGLSLPTSTPDDHPNLKGLTPPFKTQLRQKSKDLLIEEELRRRRCVHYAVVTFYGCLRQNA